MSHVYCRKCGGVRAEETLGDPCLVCEVERTAVPFFGVHHPAKPPEGPGVYSNTMAQAIDAKSMAKNLANLIEALRLRRERGEVLPLVRRDPDARSIWDGWDRG